MRWIKSLKRASERSLKNGPESLISRSDTMSVEVEGRSEREHNDTSLPSDSNVDLIVCMCSFTTLGSDKSKLSGVRAMGLDSDALATIMALS
jgi:hypothetical protein